MTTEIDRGRVLAAMELVMGELPGDERRVAPNVQTLEETSESGVTRRKISFATEANDRCFAWVLIPHERMQPRANPGAAMLCLHQTTRIGKDEPVGLGGLPNLHYAEELVKRGYIVMAPDYPRFGDYHPDVYALGYASATMKGIWNHMRAMDLICDMPGVCPDRVGCIGHSLGAHNALFLAAFDERVSAVVSSCGFTSFKKNDDEGRGDAGNIKDWSHAGYMPRIAERYDCRAEKMPFDFPDVLSLIAPRPLFINAPLEDFFRFEGVDDCVALTRHLFDAAGADRLVLVHPEGKHDFPPAVREQAYAWLERMRNGDG